MGANVGLEILESCALAAAGKNRPRVDRPPGEVFVAPLTDGPVTFERQAEGIKARMTGGATRVFPVFGQHVRNGISSFASSAGSSGTEAGGGGMVSPSRRR